MNNRIRELATKSNIHFAFDSYGEFASMPENNQSLLALNNFAEALILEVIKEVESQVFWHGIDTVDDPSWYKAIDRVKRHFGVK
jgi:hypothetical protein